MRKKDLNTEGLLSNKNIFRRSSDQTVTIPPNLPLICNLYSREEWGKQFWSSLAFGDLGLGMWCSSRRFERVCCPHVWRSRLTNVQAKCNQSVIILLLLANLSNTDLAHDKRDWADVARSPILFGYYGVERIACEQNLRLDLFNLNIFHFPCTTHLLIQVQQNALCVQFYILYYMLLPPTCFDWSGPS